MGRNTEPEIDSINTQVAKRQQREEQRPERSEAGKRCPNNANKSEYEKLGD
jgi:hypothetical protein